MVFMNMENKIAHHKKFYASDDIGIFIADEIR